MESSIGKVESIELKFPVVDLLQEHLEEVVEKTWNRWGRCQSNRDHITNAVFGLTAESGEVADLFKKGFYHKEMSEEATAAWMDSLISEMGDVIYYWIKLASIFEVPVEEILAYNRKKLFARLENDKFTGTPRGLEADGGADAC